MAVWLTRFLKKLGIIAYAPEEPARETRCSKCREIIQETDRLSLALPQEEEEIEFIYFCRHKKECAIEHFRRVCFKRRVLTYLRRTKGLCVWRGSWTSCKIESGKDKKEACGEHTKIRCAICRVQATNECFLATIAHCGMPLCDECECPVHNPYFPHLDFKSRSQISKI